MANNVIVVDTSVFIKRPIVLEKLIEHFDKIIIPQTVIEELNYLKDHNKNVEQKAWLAMRNISEMKNNKIIIKQGDRSLDNNDKKIASCAIEYAKLNPETTIYMYSDDVYFNFLVNQWKNIKNITPKNFDEIFISKENYDISLTKKFLTCIKNGEIEKIKTMNLKSVDINAIDSQTGYPPLIIAIRNRDYQMLKFLVQLNGIDLEKHDETKYKFTPLLHVCQIKNMQLMKILVENGASVNNFGRGVNFGNTPLMVCAWGNFKDGAAYLSHCDVSFNQQDNNGFTALHKACIKDNYEIAKILIDEVDLRIEDHKNKRAQDYLTPTSKNYKKMVELFSGKDRSKL